MDQITSTIIIYIFISSTLQMASFVFYAGNDLLEYSPYEPVNSRLSDIFRLAPIIAGKVLLLHVRTFRRFKFEECAKSLYMSNFSVVL